MLLRGIEPPTSSLPMTCSTPELQQHRPLQARGRCRSGALQGQHDTRKVGFEMTEKDEKRPVAGAEGQSCPRLEAEIRPAGQSPATQGQGKGDADGRQDLQRRTKPAISHLIDHAVAPLTAERLSNSTNRLGSSPHIREPHGSAQGRYSDGQNHRARQRRTFRHDSNFRREERRSAAHDRVHADVRNADAAKHATAGGCGFA